MDPFRRKLMLRESARRLGAAEILSRAGDDSDSGYLLRLLALELLLKVLVERETGESAPWHHRYEELFSSLTEATQSELLATAGQWIGPSELVNDHFGVLRGLGRNFIRLRYPYQEYEGLSESEYLRAGKDWVDAGGASKEATFRFHPEELRGLIKAAQELTSASA